MSDVKTMLSHINKFDTKLRFLSLFLTVLKVMTNDTIAVIEANLTAVFAFQKTETFCFSELTSFYCAFKLFRQ